MKKIHKYEYMDDGFHHLPIGAEILSVQEQRDFREGYRDDRIIQVWAMVDPKQDREWRKINLYATGEEIPDIQQRYINTLQRNSGLVYHAFEVLE